MIKLIGVNETLSTQVRGQGATGKLLRQRTVGIVDLQRRCLCFMRPGLCADQLAELRHIPRGITGAMKTRESATLVYKTNQTADHLRIGEDFSIAAVHKYRVVIENLGILQVIQVVAEDRLESPRRICHLLDSEIRMRSGVVIVSAGRSNIHDEKLPGRFRR